MSYLQFSRFPILSARLDLVRAKASDQTDFGHKAADALREIDLANNAAEFLDAMHGFQRLYLICALGLHDNPEAVALADDRRFHTWKDFNALPATPAQQDIVAELLYGGDPQRRAPILLNLCDYGRGIGELIIQKCIDKKAEFDPWFVDPRFHRSLLNLLNDDQVIAYGELMAKRRESGIKRTIGMSVDQDPIHDVRVEPAKMKTYAMTAEARINEQSRNLFYTSTRLPTPAGAVVDGMEYQDYVDLFFRMCAVDWEKINQAHLILIHKLNGGKILRLTNNDGTDLRMNIEGFTFCNSRVAKNVPGSEVFSAPHRDSVNGKIVAKGMFSDETTGKLIENITLEFEQGRLVRYDADKGLEYLTRSVETDEGSHYVGEIGIGTNPALKRHIVNSLMVEKIGGSFHIALGRAYEFKDYLGTPVNVDNGNRSKIHWDITTMLYGKQGRMVLDDHVIIDDGLFVDPELAYLNGPV